MAKVSRRIVLSGLGAAATGLTIRRSRAQAEPIKIGMVAPLTGPAAPVGFANHNGAVAARNSINRNGGVNGRQIELTVRDSATKPEQAAAAARELIGQGNNLLLSETLSATSRAILPLLGELNAVGIVMSAGEPSYTHELFTPHIFVTAPSYPTRMRGAAQFAATRYPDVTSWAGEFPDIKAGYDGWNYFTKAIQEMYPKIAHNSGSLKFFDPVLSKFGATDFKPQISQLMAYSAAGFWTQLYGTDSITFYKQAMQFGFNDKFKMMIDAGTDIDLPKTLKQNVPSKVWGMSFFYYGATLSSPMTQELVKVSTEAGDPYPHHTSFSGHTPVMAYAAAIRATGSTDTDKVIAALETTSFESLSGPFRYRKEDHQGIGRNYMVNWAPSDQEPGWKAREFVAIEDENLLLPPEPGKKSDP